MHAVRFRCEWAILEAAGNVSWPAQRLTACSCCWCSPANGLAQKLYNWSTLNQKVRLLRCDGRPLAHATLELGCAASLLAQRVQGHVHCSVGTPSGPRSISPPSPMPQVLILTGTRSGVPAPGLCAAAPGVRGGRGLRPRRCRACPEAAACAAFGLCEAAPAGQVSCRRQSLWCRPTVSNRSRRASNAAPCSWSV